MKRSHFLLATATPLLAAGAWSAARAQPKDDDVDPALSAESPSLRILLGRGTAVATPGGGFTYEGRNYRGTSTSTDDGIVNQVGIEEYLYSVVPREMSPSWPAAALQAQAICARTYVLERSSPRRGYDVVPSQADQVYNGVEAESPSGRAAVDATTGMVMRFGGGFAQTLYSSCCGGHTEASSDAWGGVPISYLMGLACPYCADAPPYRWELRLALDTIGSAFPAQLAECGTLNGVQIGPLDPSGRARLVQLIGDRGAASVKAATFRSALGAGSVKSTFFSAMTLDRTAEPPTVFIQGAGSGHGVGLCQWGARGAALAGLSASQILAFYFPGTQLSND